MVPAKLIAAVEADDGLLPVMDTSPELAVKVVPELREVPAPPVVPPVPFMVTDVPEIPTVPDVQIPLPPPVPALPVKLIAPVVVMLP
jgi:hypothetical protein